MKLNLIYKFYAQTNLCADDYFNEILSRIEPEYPHEVTDTRIIYSPVDFDDQIKASENGIQTIEKECTFGSHPHYIIKEMIVTFYDIPEDFRDVCDHIIEKFGDDAVRSQIIEEQHLNDIGPFCEENDEN